MQVTIHRNDFLSGEELQSLGFVTGSSVYINRETGKLINVDDDLSNDNLGSENGWQYIGQLC